MNGNEIVSDFVAHTAWEKLPPAVQRKARMAQLDILGATLAGTLTPVSRIAAGYAVETWPGDEATILQHGYRASAIGAAFANGYAANGMDIDDCALHTRDHPGAQIFPTALALTESLGLGGAEMLTAMVVGYEVAHRIVVDGLAWKKYACCAWVHAALKGVEELVKAHHIRAEVVAHVRVEAPHDTVRLDTELPTTEEAQVQRSLASGSPAGGERSGQTRCWSTAWASKEYGTCGKDRIGGNGRDERALSLGCRR